MEQTKKKTDIPNLKPLDSGWSVGWLVGWLVVLKVHVVPNVEIDSHVDSLQVAWLVG